MEPTRSHLRRHDRVTVESPVQLLWKDRSGVDSSANGRTVDISDAGMRVRSPVPIDRGVYVTFNATKVPLQGTGSVRDCKRQGMGYLIGLEFSGGLRWKPKGATSK